MRIGKQHLRSLLAAAMLASLVFGAIAVSRAASPHHKRPAEAAHPVRPAEAPALYGRFAVLRSARLAASASPDTALPAEYAEHLVEAGTIYAKFELEPAEAHVVPVAGTSGLWVIPGRNGICLAIPDAVLITTDCGSVAKATTDGLMVVQRPSSGPVVYGLVPDGASVSAEGMDGSATTVGVADNVFRRTAASLRAMSVRTATGSVVQPVALSGQ
jgi:hypothetical protein